MGARGAQDDYVDTVDEIVSGLQQDPVLVQDVMGNGHTAEVDAALSTLVEGAAFPVYVALTVAPRDLHGSAPVEELLELLHGRLGPGVYVVATTETDLRPEVGVYVDLVADDNQDGTLLSLAHRQAEEQVEQALDRIDDDLAISPAGHAALVLEMLDEPLADRPGQPLTADELSAYTGSVWTDARPRDGEGLGGDPSVGPTALLAVGVGLTVTAVAYRLLQARTAAREQEHEHVPVRGELPDSATLRDDVGARVAHLADRLSSLSPRPSAAPLDGRERARASLRGAESLLGSTRPLDLVAALVLTRTGERALHRPGAPAYRCCFLNPLHGEGVSRADVVGREQVPVCRRCERAAAHNQPLQPLLEPRRLGRTRPYYAGDARWVASGFGALDPDGFLDLAGGDH